MQKGSLSEEPTENFDSTALLRIFSLFQLIVLIVQPTT